MYACVPVAVPAPDASTTTPGDVVPSPQANEAVLELRVRHGEREPRPARAELTEPLTGRHREPVLDQKPIGGQALRKPVANEIGRANV